MHTWKHSRKSGSASLMALYLSASSVDMNRRATTEPMAGAAVWAARATDTLASVLSILMAMKFRLLAHGLVKACGFLSEQSLHRVSRVLSLAWGRHTKH